MFALIITNDALKGSNNVLLMFVMGNYFKEKRFKYNEMFEVLFPKFTVLLYSICARFLRCDFRYKSTVAFMVGVPPRKGKGQQATKEIMFTLFWDCEGIFLSE